MAGTRMSDNMLPRDRLGESLKYRDRRKELAAFQRERRAANKRYVDAYKSAVGCFDCGYGPDTPGFDVHALDCDHLPGHWKRDDISRLIDSRTDQLMLEMTKVDVVCKNCHAVRTRKRHDNRKKLKSLGMWVDPPKVEQLNLDS